MTDTDRIDRARSLLVAPAPVVGSPWSTLGAAAVAASAAVLMAGVVVLGPGVQFDDPTVEAALR